jgi:hypothetical protein
MIDRPTVSGRIWVGLGTALLIELLVAAIVIVIIR